MTTPSAAGEWIYYDGDCGVCQRSVQFILKRDGREHPFHFAPLYGDTFEQRLEPEQRQDLPDSLVIETKSGGILTRTSGVVYILRRLPGLWPLLGFVLWLVPRPLRNFGYDLFARYRSRFSSLVGSSCSVPTPEQSERFAS